MRQLEGLRLGSDDVPRFLHVPAIMDRHTDGGHDPGVLVTEHNRHSRQDWDFAFDYMNIALTKSDTSNRDHHLAGPGAGVETSSICKGVP